MAETGGKHDESLAGQRLRLASLETCEDRIRALREQECELEVEHMATVAALQTATSRLEPTIDGALASRIGYVLERRRELEQGQRASNKEHGLRSGGNPRQADRLRAGLAALQAWLDAARPRKPGSAVNAAKIILLLATVASVWAAFAIHPAFLLLLVLVAGPVSFAMNRGQDSEWQRMGARRHFEAVGLAEPAEWNDERVRERIAELQALLASVNRPAAPSGSDAAGGSAVDTQSELRAAAEIDEQFASDLAAAGLTDEDTQGDTGEWLRLVARADRSRESLERVKDERRRLRAEAAEHRDHLLSYLQSHGARPTRLPDTAAAIAEGLERLSDAP